MNSITLDRAPIHSVIGSLMRVRGIGLTSKDVANVMNSFDNEQINAIELKLGDSEFISAQGQFPSLIQNLSSDDEQIVFVEYNVIDIITKKIIGGLYQMYWLW